MHDHATQRIAHKSFDLIDHVRKQDQMHKYHNNFSYLQNFNQIFQGNNLSHS